MVQKYKLEKPGKPTKPSQRLTVSAANCRSGSFCGSGKRIWLAPAFGASRDDVYKVLREHNVFCRKYFYPLISDYPCYRQLATAARENLVSAVTASEEVLCMPFYGDLEPADIEEICSIIRDIPSQNC